MTEEEREAQRRIEAFLAGTAGKRVSARGIRSSGRDDVIVVITVEDGKDELGFVKYAEHSLDIEDLRAVMG